MKPPQTSRKPIQEIRKNLMHKEQREVMHRIVAQQAFADQSEYALPGVRAVWSVIESNESEEDDENRRKRK